MARKRPPAPRRRGDSGDGSRFARALRGCLRRDLCCMLLPTPMC
jgi:hypothetical protein